MEDFPWQNLRRPPPSRFTRRSHDRSGVCWGRYVICQTLLWYIGCLKNGTLCLPRGFFFCHHFISNESAHSVKWSPQWCLHLVVLVPLMAPNCFSLGSTRGSITMPTNVNTQPCVQVTVLRVYVFACTCLLMHVTAEHSTAKFGNLCFWKMVSI